MSSFCPRQTGSVRLLVIGLGNENSTSCFSALTPAFIPVKRARVNEWNKIAFMSSRLIKTQFLAVSQL